MLKNKDKVTAKQKAQRQQNRKDRNTDTDRSVNKANRGDQQGRRAARQENFNAQGSNSASDFDFNQHGKGHVGNQEVSHLKKQGNSREDIMSAAKSSGGDLGERTEKKFSRWEAKAKAKEVRGQKPPTNESGNEAVNPQQPANPNPSPNVTNTQEQNVVQDNDQVSTVTGNNNTVTQEQDNSVSQMGGDSRTQVGGENTTQVGTGIGIGDFMRDQMSNPSYYSEAGAADEAEKLKNSYIDTIRPGTTTEMDTAIKNTQKQEISQDNDQTSEINGNDNTVIQEQDNSVRNYGGDNRSFVYNGGNSGVDTPASMATLAGFFSVDDSPAAQAKFHDLHNTLNNDAQKKYSNFGSKLSAKFGGFDARSYDPDEQEANNLASTQRSYDEATVAKNKVFGDLSGARPEYKFGAPPKSIYDDDKDDDE